MAVMCGESAALGASLGVGPAPKVVCRSKSATPPSSPFLRGTASPWSNLAAIPPHLCRGEPRQKCSGQPGCSRPGCWRRQSPNKPVLDCAGLRPASAAVRHTLIPGAVPVREDRCTPHQRQCVAHRVGRPGPGPGGRLPTHIVGLFRCSREPEVSLPRRSRARRPTLPDRLRGQRSAALRVLGHLETQRLIPASKEKKKQPPAPAPPTSL